MTESIRNITAALACLNLICGIAYASTGYADGAVGTFKMGVTMLCISAVLAAGVFLASKLQRG